MSNFFEVALSSLTGIAVFYVFEAFYYEIKARINGRQYEKFLEELEEEIQP